MKTNEGTIDRVVRVVLGAIAVSLVFVGPATPWGWLGLIGVFTGLVGWCPIYAALGFATCPVAAGPDSKQPAAR